MGGLEAAAVECIGKGKARKPCEFGVKSSLVVTHKQGLMVGARTFPGNPYDSHTLAAQLEQTGILLQDIEPAIGHVKCDHRMDRCWLHSATGDALHTVLCAAGFNIRWLLVQARRTVGRAV